MTEADEVADFLLSTESYIVYALGRLNFSVEGFRIDIEGYREIGHKIRSGAITVAVGRRSAGSQVAAVYSQLRDRLSVPANLDLHTPGPARVSNQSLIVHEVTHALVDFHRFACTGAVDEACGYIADQVYAKALGLQQTGAGGRSGAIITAAQAIVTGRQMTTRTGARLTVRDPDVAVLITAITAHSNVYPDAGVHTTPGGIPGGLLNPWYMPRN